LRCVQHDSSGGQRAAGVAAARGLLRRRPVRDRDTRLTWGCVIRVAAGARMWLLIRLH
jgi:hypothetical protein